MKTKNDYWRNILLGNMTLPSALNYIENRILLFVGKTKGVANNPALTTIKKASDTEAISKL